MVRKKLDNHRAVAHSTTTLEKIRLVRAGAELTGTHRVFGAAYRLLDPNKPAPTVTRSGFRDFVHPEEDRLCTIRELARLQTFPDNYVFKGRRCDTYASSRYRQQTQHEQVGNAVPPLLARSIARAIKHQLADRDLTSLKSARRRFERVFPLLDAAYPESDLGNKKDPLDELIYILLSRRAREAMYQKTYDLLAERFRPWSRLAEADPEEVKAVLTPLGLATQRYRALIAVIDAIRADFGKVSLAALKRVPETKSYYYLRSLPGVNDKSAKCVMMYSLGHDVLPVDTHTLRVSLRLGLLPRGTSLYRAPRILDAVVPPEYRRRYHVLTVLHGRAACSPRPRGVCPLGKHCCRRGC